MSMFCSFVEEVDSTDGSIYDVESGSIYSAVADPKCVAAGAATESDSVVAAVSSRCVASVGAGALAGAPARAAAGLRRVGAVVLAADREEVGTVDREENFMAAAWSVARRSPNLTVEFSSTLISIVELIVD
jgi:hypothetical protein